MWTLGFLSELTRGRESQHGDTELAAKVGVSLEDMASGGWEAPEATELGIHSRAGSAEVCVVQQTLR